MLGLVRGILRKAPSWYPDLRLSSAVINGQAGILTWSRETLVAVITCETAGERISALYEVINPEKLIYMQRQLQQEQ